MTTRLTQLALAATAATMLATTGCTTVTPNLDMALGKNFTTIKAMQTMNPNASSNTRTATLDGQTARDVLTRYNDSYKTPPVQTNVFTIGVGGK